MCITELLIMHFAENFCIKMGWEPLDIIRIKICAMHSYKGLCIEHTGMDGFFILVSTEANKSNKEFFASLIHELIHGHINQNLKKNKKWHRHDTKLFKKLAKQVEQNSNGFFSWKEIVK